MGFLLEWSFDKLAFRYCYYHYYDYCCNYHVL